MSVNLFVVDPSSNQLVASFVQHVQEFSLGRNASCGVAIPNQYTNISGQHALIRTYNSYFEILDGSLNKPSTNGVFLNGLRLPPLTWTRANYGADIYLGSPTKKGSLLLSISKSSESTSAPPQSPVATLSSIHHLTNAPKVQYGSSNQPFHVAFVRPERTRPYSKTAKNIAIHLAILLLTIVLILLIGSADWTGAFVALIIIILEIYFIPTTIAFCRGLPNRFAIFAINLCLGLTLIGWAVSLAWSLTAR